MTLEEFKQTPYAWPGGYQIIGILTDGGTICHQCAVNEDVIEEDEWMDAFVHWEGDALYCCHCSQAIDSEYGHLDDQAMLDMDE